MSNLIKKHPVLSFIILAYLGSWLGWSPWWLSQSGIGLLPYQLELNAIAGINQLGLLAGPLFSAFLVTRIVDGRAGLKKFQDSFTAWRVGLWWYLLALVLIPVAVGLGYFIFAGTAVASGLELSLIGTLISTFFIYILGGPIQEEPGWRGFALPRMQKSMSPIAAALLLGVVHCFWHTPLFFTREWDTARSDFGQLAAYLVLILAMSIVMSWLWNGSKGSILLVILGHNTVNFGLFLVAALSGAEVINNWPAALGLSVLALVAIVVSKGTLGYKAVESAHGGTN